MNKLLLNMVMLFSGLWRSMGADVVQLRAILQARLLMDDRRPIGIGRQQKKARKHYGVRSVIMYCVFGFFYMFPLLYVHDRILSLTMYFSLFLTIMTMMLLTDFSSVLFDSRDKYILFPRPVNDRTLVLARLLHVFVYLLRIVLPMSLAGWITLGIIDGWKSALLFPLPLLLMVSMALFFVNGIYLLVLKVVKPEKFKDIISYFQVVASVIFFACVYLLPRFFDSEHTENLKMADYPWARYTPSYWLALCWSWIGYPVELAGTAMLSSLAVICPFVFMYILVRWLAPTFARRMAGIDTVETAEDKRPGVKREAPGKFYKKLAYSFNQSDDARAGFMIAWLQSSRSRSFRMRVFPTFAFIPVYFVYILTQNHTSFTHALLHLKDHHKHLILLYMSSFVMINALSYTTISDQYKAAWVYYATPLQIPGKVMLGAFKAIWIKYFLPFFIMIAAFVLWVWGAPAIIDIILALVNVTLFIACIARISQRHLPFSIMEQMKDRGSRFVRSVLMMLIPFLLGFGHYFSMNLLWLKLLFLVLSAIMLWLVADSYSNTSWENMIRREAE